MTSYTVSQIADALGADLFGDGSLTIARAAEPADAGPDDLALAMDPKYADGLAQGQARAAMLWQGADWQALGLKAAIVVPRPRYAMSGLTQMLDPGPADRARHPPDMRDRPDCTDWRRVPPSDPLS